MIWDAYHGKTLFLTGTTGFVGSALLLRILNRASPAKIYILCRGGPKGAASKWDKLLPSSLAQQLTQDPRIVVLDGDMTAINFGLSDIDIAHIKSTIHYIIHSASTIHLRMKLKELSYSVLAPSIWLARLAFESPNLERFVFVSTAYANAHLWSQEQGSEVRVEEVIHPLLDHIDPAQAARNAWHDVQTNGTTAEYEAHDFPSPYAYAKHLAERLLLSEALQHKSAAKLLIVRPSIIGSAQEHPFPGFATATSTPTTACAPAFVLHPCRKMRFASRCPNPSQDSTIDEVPVDVVVDRILAHLSMGTNGCVHAVSGLTGRVSIQEWADANNLERRLPWNVKLEWTNQDWNARDLSQLARIFKIIGASFDFAQERTFQLRSKLAEDDLDDMKLLADKPKKYSVAARRHYIRELGIELARRKKYPVFLVKLLIRKEEAQITAAKISNESETTLSEK